MANRIDCCCVRCIEHVKMSIALGHRQSLGEVEKYHGRHDFSNRRQRSGLARERLKRSHKLPSGLCLSPHSHPHIACTTSANTQRRSLCRHNHASKKKMDSLTQIVSPGPHSTKCRGRPAVTRTSKLAGPDGDSDPHAESTPNLYGYAASTRRLHRTVVRGLSQRVMRQRRVVGVLSRTEEASPRYSSM
jgi:hypothetical protein